MNLHRKQIGPPLLLLITLMIPNMTLAQATPTHTFAIGENDFLLDGKRFEIRCGEIHSMRVPREYWQHRLRMVHAMGLNTVCAYLFWNVVEPAPGKFDWSGQADIAEFCRAAQAEGLWVILRPGPYACAEWEMGGFPWWLLKNPDIQLRTRDPRYLDAAKAYLHEVGRELHDLQITHGGPILMVQVENEYGFYANDAEYMGVLRQALLDSGFDVPLFACNPTAHLRDGYRDDLFPVVNFGTDPAGSFKALREILPHGPLMCGEFYPGWFDTWGAPHHTGNTGRYLTDLQYMLSHGNSFSIYMAHGGTTFGLWSGADRPFKPDTSSYDYDAPISEAGWPTEKFEQTRDLMEKYLLPGEAIPEPPPRNPVMSFDATKATQCAPVFSNLSAPISDDTPRSFEDYDQAHGLIVYRTTLPPGLAAPLRAKDVHDYAFLYLDGERVGFMDRRTHRFTAEIPARQKSQTLDVVLEAVGRVNFGPEVHDHKGLFAPVTLAGEELHNWQIYKFPLDDPNLASLNYSSAPVAGPAFWKIHVAIESAADTFLDMRSWSKGVVWVNGHCLGRFWNIGPTQTMYVPGPWLHVGENEFIVLDLLGPSKPEIAGLEKPILNELRPDLDFDPHRRPHVDLAIENAAPVHAGEFARGSAVQEIHFDKPATGRYFAIQALDAQDGKPYAAIAELDLLDSQNKPISHDSWTIAYVDSEERSAEDGSAENALDGQATSFWHTQYSDAKQGYPHLLIIDLAQPREIAGFRYTPRQGANNVAGRIKDYRIYVGNDLVKK
jgi:beta-galactosidase